MEKRNANSGGTKSPSAKKQIAAKVRYIAECRGVPVNEVWAAVVFPAVQTEFERCGGDSPKPAKKG